MKNFKNLTMIRQRDKAKFKIAKWGGKYHITEECFWYSSEVAYIYGIGISFDNDFDSWVHAYIFLKENIENLL